MTSDLLTPYRGGFVGPEHRFALTVYFEDTYTAGIVYYANYLKFMERARSDMLRAVGVDQKAAIDRGEGVYAVAEVNLRYLRPAKLGDDLLIGRLGFRHGIKGGAWQSHQRAPPFDGETTGAVIPDVGPLLGNAALV